ncbi:MAG: EscU/YscU/HrcU family type III secretion system export apparatus switch protein [Bryobacteraceae bacterium]
MPDQGQKTEQPTQRRLQKSRSEGRFPVSRDLISALQFVTIFALALNLFQQTAVRFEQLFKELIQSALSGQDLTVVELHRIYQQLIFPFLSKLLLLGFGLAVTLALIQLITTRFGFALKQLIPDPARLNSLSRIRQLPAQNFASVVRSVILLVVISYLVYLLIKQQLGELTSLAGASVPAGLANAASLLKRLMTQLAVVLIVFGVIDFVRQRSKFNKNLRMTKQEIKDEVKDAEGNIQMKLRIRRLQRDAMRRNMIKAVQKASVVIVNPTHYAIAIHYEMGTRTVPTVVAKGKNFLAQIIRERAQQHDIPIVENKPLAQALYQAVNVGDEIPQALYRAVAEVLGQIYRVLNRQ